MPSPNSYGSCEDSSSHRRIKNFCCAHVISTVASKPSGTGINININIIWSSIIWTFTVPSRKAATACSSKATARATAAPIDGSDQNFFIVAIENTGSIDAANPSNTENETKK
jgi:hypothetical protein